MKKTRAVLVAENERMKRALEQIVEYHRKYKSDEEWFGHKVCVHTFTGAAISAAESALAEVDGGAA